jgi:hypothetical protein
LNISLKFLFALTFGLAVVFVGLLTLHFTQNETCLRSAATHEAGHVIYAWHSLTGRVTEVQLNDDASGVTWFAHPQSDSPEVLWDKCAESAAGAQAVRLFTEQSWLGDDVDLMDERDNAEQLRNRLSSGYANAMPPWRQGRVSRSVLTDENVLTECADRAAKVLSAHAREVQLVSDALYERRSLQAADIAKLIGPRTR